MPARRGLEEGGKMVSLNQVEEQLERIGCNFRFWGRPEIRELPKILMKDEIIAGAVNGRYKGGGAMLVATNYRLLLVDRKPLFLTTEDVRFDMIAELDFNARLLNSTIYVVTPTRELRFTSWSHHRLRVILNYAQQRVMEVRQHFLQQQFAPSYAVDPRVTASWVGGLALQAGASQSQQRMMPVNPYTKVPLITSRRAPRF